MNDTLKHLSISSIQTYMKCGVQWYFRYVEGLKIPPGVAMVKGRSFHKAEEENFRQKMESHQDLPVEEVKEVFSSTYDYEIQDARIREDEDIGVEKDSGLIALAEFHVKRAPQIVPVGVEESNAIEVGGHAFVSRIDLLDGDKAIRDLKLKSKTPPEDAAKVDMQLTGYDLTYRKTRGEAPSKLVLDCAISTKVPKLVQREAPPRSLDVLEAFENHVSTVVDAIGKGVFLPAPSDSWVCTEKWCGYFDQCKFGRKRSAK